MPHPDLVKRKHPIVEDIRAMIEYYEGKADRARRSQDPAHLATTQHFVAQGVIDVCDRVVAELENLLGENHA